MTPALAELFDALMTALSSEDPTGNAHALAIHRAIAESPDPTASRFFQTHAHLFADARGLLSWALAQGASPALLEAARAWAEAHPDVRGYLSAWPRRPAPQPCEHPRLVRTFRADTSNRAWALLPDERHALIGPDRVDLDTGERVRVLDQYGQPTRWSVSPDGTLWLVWQYDKLQVLDPVTYRVLAEKRFGGHDNAAAVDATSERIAVCADGRLSLFDRALENERVLTGSIAASLHHARKHLAFSRDGRELCLEDGAGHLRVYDVASERPDAPREVLSHYSEARAVCFDPAHDRAFVLQSYDTLVACDLASKRSAQRSARTYWNYLAVARDGATFAGMHHERVYVHDAASLEPRGEFVLTPHPHQFDGLLWRSDDTALTLDSRDRVRKWDLSATRRTPPSAPEAPVFTGEVLHVIFTQDGRHLVASGPGEDEKGPTVVLFDTRSGERVEVPRKKKGARKAPPVPDEWASPLAAARCGREGHGAPLWDLARSPPKLVRTSGHKAPSVCVAFRADGSLAATGAKHEVQFWDPHTTTFVRTVAMPDAVTVMAFAADGALFAACSGRLHRIDASTGERTHTWNVPTGRVTCLALHPDGVRVAAGGYQYDVAVIDTSAPSTQNVRSLPITESYGAVRSVQWAGEHLVAWNGFRLTVWKDQTLVRDTGIGKHKVWPDGKHLAHWDRSFELQELLTGKPALRFEYDVDFECADFGPDGLVALGDRCGGVWSFRAVV